jgi:hypothetical protein
MWVTDTTDIAPDDLAVERVRTAPYDPCFRYVIATKIVGILYWDGTVWDECGEHGWAYFTADAPQHHDVIGTELSEAEAITFGAREIAKKLSRRDRAIVGLDDLPPHQLPWRLLREDEAPPAA